jgi:hypothetical protein
MSTLNKKLEGVYLAMLIIISASLILSTAAVSTAPVVEAKKYSDNIMDQDGKDANSEETKVATDGKDAKADNKDGKDGKDDKGLDGKDANSEETEVATDGKDANSVETELASDCSSEELSDDASTENSDDASTENSDISCDKQLVNPEELNTNTLPSTTAPVSVF